MWVMWQLLTRFALTTHYKSVNGRDSAAFCGHAKCWRRVKLASYKFNHVEKISKMPELFYGIARVIYRLDFNDIFL